MTGRYPASLSRKPAQQRPPRTVSPASSSIDDEVPAAPLPELASLEILLRQAGYKETRVFTPEAERRRPRLKTLLDDDESAELAEMYAAMGLDPRGSIQVRHLTRPNEPLRSSSSVLRNVALQDATALLNEVRKRRLAAGPGQELPDAADVFWRPEILDRAAAEAMGRHIATISPPSRNSTDGVGLGLAQQGRGVRKAKSNFELVRKPPRSPEKEDIPPEYYSLHRQGQPPTAPAHTTAFQCEVPPSIAAMFSPPTFSSPQPDEPHFVDDAFGWGQLPDDYESQEADDSFAEAYGSGDSDSDSVVSRTSVRSSPSIGPVGAESPPLLDTEQLLRDLVMGSVPAIETDGESAAESDEIALAQAEAAAIGQRILASTVEYDDDESEDEFDPNSSPTPNPKPAGPVPVFSVTSPSPPSHRPKMPMPASPSPARRAGLAKRAPAVRAAPPIRTPRKIISREASLAEAMSESVISPPRLAKPLMLPASPLRASKSVPALSKRKSVGPFAITPAVTAAPSVQRVAPVLCDSSSNDAEDLPPLPIPPMNDDEPTTSIGYMALKARKSLSALRASFWAAPPEKPLPLPSASTLTAPILAPRLDWSAQGAQFAGWGSDQNEKQHKSRGSVESSSSIGTMHEIDPFDDSCPIDYSKSFFYKPATPPRRFGTAPSRLGMLNKRASVKSLRRALQIPVAAPPVPRVPSKYLSVSNATLGGARSPPRPQPPVIRVHSPGAIEEGRPPRALSLTGEEWEGREVVRNWGKGVRRRRSRRLPRPVNPFSDICQ
ncbi:hypothetical protein CspeluHIS016_0111090 [Cutaneotrichosporon spelunceum]|uniref:Uncharacterized protein n=1 Tax=Cutaneotrichosporon spelunceum TaxID=1672016 RepID=A0AAD3TPC1_9TREE|nr:hypothetical protein CspeluHIS016_0111090 [Cutaneotrichosporon spelunceum]